MDNQVFDDVVKQSKASAETKPLFLVVATTRTGNWCANEEVLLFDDEEKAIEMERLLWLIYGRKFVLRTKLWIGQLPQNLIEAIESSRRMTNICVWLRQKQFRCLCPSTIMPSAMNTPSTVSRGAPISLMVSRLERSGMNERSPARFRGLGLISLSLLCTSGSCIAQTQEAASIHSSARCGHLPQVMPPWYGCG